MQPFRFRGQIIFVGVLAALLTLAGGGWWLCERSDSIAFLPSTRAAEWIVDPAPPENKVHWAFPIRAIFKRTFALETPAANATLTVRAFKNATVSVNGHEITNLKCDGKNWKSPATVSITGLLQAGTNDITVCVTNSLGPPALWLQLQAGEFSLGSDESWQVSLAGADWQAAHRASQPVVIPNWSPFYDKSHTWHSMRLVWRDLAFFSFISLGLILCAGRWQSSRPADFNTAKPIYFLFAIIVIARAALFIHDMPRLELSTGFDATPHKEYIKFIQEKEALPLPNDGWEMHQPPLYYMASTVWLNICGLSAGNDDAVISLRAVNGIVGLIHCWLALLCFRRLFPENLPAQVVGLLVASFLPANLYLSMYVINDPLAGLFVTVAFYFFLRLLESEKENPKLALGIGLALGAAMLTKLSSVLAVPVFLAAMGLRLLLRNNFPAREWLRGVGVVTLACALMCGWHYGRVWKQIGALPLPNSQTNPSSAWWQEPGFHTASYYFSFGHSLVAPLFSGLHSFADGIYSTLWGDGLISGRSQLMFRPPWNYDLMNAGYLLSVVIAILAVIGLVISIRQFIRRPDPKQFVIPALIFAFFIGIVYLTLRGPWLAHVKAFYAIPALVPFSAVIAMGWNWLAQKNRALRIALWMVVLVWTLTACSTYWIRDNNSETWRNRAIMQIRQQHNAEAIEYISHALQLDPKDVNSHCILAEALNNQNKPMEAIQQYTEALQISPDSPYILNDLAQMLASGEKTDAERAVPLAERACQLTGFKQTDMVSTLALAYERTGQFEKAVATVEKACVTASETGRAELFQTSQGALATYLNNFAWLLATSPDAAIRDGQRAVQMAERACKITADQQPIFIGTLAAAYAEAGKFDEAIATAQRACDLAEKSGDTDLLQKNRRLLELYRTNKPFHEMTPSK